MRSWFLVLGLMVLPAFSVGQETKRAPIPSKEAQDKIQNLLQELYADDFAKAKKDPALRARLAQTLLFEGKETKDNIAGRYVLFTKAHQLAAEAGDVSTALQAVDELGRDFLIPAVTVFQMKIAMLQKASQAVGAAPDAYQAVIERALLTLDDTLDADDFPSSLALIVAAEQSARKLKSLPIYVTMRKRHDEISRLQKEFARWQPFADRFAKDPDDADAGHEMGKYHALVKGDWERGLPLLARGTKSDLQSLAASDLKMPDTDGARRVVALGWYTFGTNKATDASLRPQALLRAYHWYQENFATALDDQRSVLEAKLMEIAALLPVEYRIGEITSELKRVDLSAGPVYDCAFSPDSKRFVATAYDGTLRVFNTKTFKQVRQLDGHAGKVFALAFSGDGKLVASGGFDNLVRLWDIAVGRAVKTFEGHKDYVRSVAVSTDGKWILSGGDDRTVRLWNVSTGKEELTLSGHDHTVWCVALSRSGPRALSASLDKTVRYWDLEKGVMIKRLEGHKDTVLCVAFSPDGRHAVSGSTDRTLRLWSLETGATERIFEGSGGYIQSVAFSPDGRRILSAGADNVVRLWDASTGKEIRKLEGHRDQVWHVAFSRDGRLAISAGQDNCVRIWTGGR